VGPLADAFTYDAQKESYVPLAEASGE